MSGASGEADCYQGGLLFHAHGGVHPALLHRGLLQRARACGSDGGRPHAGDVRCAARWRGLVVETVRGKLAARHRGRDDQRSILEARRLRSRVASSRFRASSSPPNRWARNACTGLIPNGVMIVETGNKHRYYRPSPDGTRIVLRRACRVASDRSRRSRRLADKRVAHGFSSRPRTRASATRLDRQCRDDAERPCPESASVTASGMRSAAMAPAWR